MMLGLAASARATPTRCRWPPDSAAGYRLANSASKMHEREQLGDARRDARRVPAEQPRRDADVLGDRQVRKQPDALEHVADTAPQ